jgi:hypothetical protein
VDLFDHIPAARNSDPETSHDAAAAVTASGVRGANAARVLAGVMAWPGRTSRELAELLRMDRHEVARRCSDLMRAGDARQAMRARADWGGGEL